MKKNNMKKLINLVCKTVGVSMEIAIVVLNILDELEVRDAMKKISEDSKR